MSISLTLLAAAGGGGHDPPLLDIDGTLAVQLGIFLLLYVVLRQTVFAPFLQMRRQRLDSISGARARSEELQRLSEERRSDYEARLLQARKEVSTERAARRAAAKAEAEAMLAAQRRKCDEKLAQARDRITGSLPAAELALRTRADQLAKMIAAKVLGRAL